MTYMKTFDLLHLNYLPVSLKKEFSKQKKHKKLIFVMVAGNVT